MEIHLQTKPAKIFKVRRRTLTDDNKKMEKTKPARNHNAKLKFNFSGC